MRFTPLLAAAIALALLGCKPGVDDIYSALPALGGPLPAFRYVGLDGSVLTPETLRGKPTVVALWSTTCSASRLALASLGALDAKYASRGARVIILANDRDSAAVASLLARAGVRASVALGAGTLLDTFTHGQSVLPWRKAFGLPTFFVLDAGGKMVYRQIGIERDARQQLGRVRASLDSLLPRPAPTIASAPAV